MPKTGHVALNNKEKKLCWRMVGQISVLKLNWHPCCRAPAKFLAKGLPGWANLWNQVWMQVWVSMRPQKPNDESSPSQRLLPWSFFSGFSHKFFFFNFSDHSQVLSLFYIALFCSLTVFFSWAFLKACCQSNIPQVRVELLNLPCSSGC